MKLILLKTLILLTFYSFANEYNIYINADFTYNKNSGESIYKGIDLALANNNYKLGNHNVNLIKCDHRGINFRSDNCIKKIINDEKGLIMYGGLHSPPSLPHTDRCRTVPQILSSAV